MQRHNRRRETCPYWLAVLSEDVHRDVNTSEFVKRTVAFTWLEQTEDSQTYTLREVSQSNSPKCILGRVTNYHCTRTTSGCTFTLAEEEDSRLCRLANGGVFDNESDREDDAEVPETESACEVDGPVRQAGVSSTGRRKTRYILSQR